MACTFSVKMELENTDTIFASRICSLENSVIKERVIGRGYAYLLEHCWHEH